MQPAKGVTGRNPIPNPFVYPHEKSLLEYDDFHAMPGRRHEEEADNDGLLDCIFLQDHLATEGSSGEHGEVAEDANRVIEGKRAEKKRGRMTRKRPSGKTDRHSKIRTAQGLRDRRIRLSVHVSRKFFDLQDMLGFDKASNTIEWLIAKSRGAIKGLSLRRGGTSSKGVPEISKCDFSSIEKCGLVNGKAVEGIQKGKSCAESSRGDIKRNLRERARVRARERTREKTMVKISESSIHDKKPKANDYPNFSASDGHRDFGSIEVIKKFLGITSASESSLHADPRGNYYLENAHYSGDDRFQDAYPESGTGNHFGGYHQ